VCIYVCVFIFINLVHIYLYIYSIYVTVMDCNSLIDLFTHVFDVPILGLCLNKLLYDIM
jgi:hypothetical protein